MEDERIEYERPMLHQEDKPLLYDAGGIPLRRRIGFAPMQTSQTYPELNKGGGKKGKGRGGKRGC